MTYPALDVRGVDAEWLLAAADDFAPSAVEEHPDRVTIFFADPEHRASAARAFAAQWPEASVISRDVDDEDWARRSQESLTPVTVGRITIAPPWHAPSSQALDAKIDRRRPSEFAGTGAELRRRDGLTIVIAPSMGFGTGHHATTRLCVAALQAIDLMGRVVLDVGTGSGVLALAARALGAREAVGVDYDRDAIHAAEENLAANPALDGVRFMVGDVRTLALPVADVVTANLTGALLVGTAPQLQRLVRPGGALILSGLLADERDDVVSAFARGADLGWEAEEQGWVGLRFNPRPESEV